MKRLILTAIIFLLSSSIALAQDFCKGDFDYDKDVDSYDVLQFLGHFGRSQYYFPCTPDGPTPPCKTGQTTSYATGDDGDLERGVALVTPRFTDNLDGTVTDNQTGLIWMKNANCFGQRNWYDALSDCNGLTDGQCGLADGSSVGDWRLPNSNELASVVHKGFWDPAVCNTAGTGHWSQGNPFTDVQSNYYWSSTIYANSIVYAWAVYMHYGLVNVVTKYNIYYLWPVRGGH